jgi:predicted amidohydrolase YtcJ
VSVPGAAIAARDGRIVFVGSRSLLDREVELTPDATIVDAHGGAVVPGFVDAIRTWCTPAIVVTSSAGG